MQPASELNNGPQKGRCYKDTNVVGYLLKFCIHVLSEKALQSVEQFTMTVAHVNLMFSKFLFSVLKHIVTLN